MKKAYVSLVLFYGVASVSLAGSFSGSVVNLEHFAEKAAPPAQVLVQKSVGNPAQSTAFQSQLKQAGQELSVNGAFSGVTTAICVQATMEQAALAAKCTGLAAYHAYKHDPVVEPAVLALYAAASGGVVALNATACLSANPFLVGGAYFQAQLLNSLLNRWLQKQPWH